MQLPCAGTRTRSQPSRECLREGVHHICMQCRYMINLTPCGYAWGLDVVCIRLRGTTRIAAAQWPQFGADRFPNPTAHADYVAMQPMCLGSHPAALPRARSEPPRLPPGCLRWLALADQLRPHTRCVHALIAPTQASTLVTSRSLEPSRTFVANLPDRFFAFHSCLHGQAPLRDTLWRADKPLPLCLIKLCEL